MKVKELIEKLSKENPEMRVVVDGYETGYDEPDMICLVSIKPNPKSETKTWEGDFDETDDDDSEVALHIPRKS
jgi:hypothetical protein